MVKREQIISFLKTNCFTDKKIAFKSLTNEISCSTTYFNHMWDFYIKNNPLNLNPSTGFKNIESVAFSAKEMISKFLDKSWKFEWSQSSTYAGVCYYKRKIIKLSDKIMQLNLNNEKFIIDTILHEIAHGIDWERNRVCGHGTSWKRICLELGGNGQRCFSSREIALPKGKFNYVCPECGHTLNCNRKLKRTNACKSCCDKHNNGRFDIRFILKLTC